MELQKKLISLAPYRAGFNIYDKQVVVNITYKDGWTVIEPNTEEVLMTKDREKKNLYYYIASMDVDFSLIFEYIDETVKYNKDLEEKAKLFKQKVKELQDVFTEENIETLRTMEFTFKKQKQKTQTKKSTSKKKKTEKVEEVVVTEDTEDNNTIEYEKEEPIDSYDDVVLGGKKSDMYEFSTVSVKNSKKSEMTDAN